MLELNQFQGKAGNMHWFSFFLCNRRTLPLQLCVSIQIPGAVDDEAVRIFLEFERVESAIKGKRLNFRGRGYLQLYRISGESRSVLKTTPYCLSLPERTQVALFTPLYKATFYCGIHRELNIASLVFTDLKISERQKGISVGPHKSCIS